MRVLLILTALFSFSLSEAQVVRKGWSVAVVFWIQL